MSNQTGEEFYTERLVPRQLAGDATYVSHIRADVAERLDRMVGQRTGDGRSYVVRYWNREQTEENHPLPILAGSLNVRRYARVWLALATQAQLGELVWPDAIRPEGAPGLSLIFTGNRGFRGEPHGWRRVI